jgi:archaeal flagellin FlaB
MFKKLIRTMSGLHEDQRGMTGLETAIILIAFVTVAAVFAYAVLSAGLFSAERGKEAVYAGLAEAKSNMEISGSVIVYADNVSETANKILFTLKNAIAGSPIDLAPCDGTATAQNKCVISFLTATDYINNVKWTKNALGTDNGDNLLQPGEQFEITIDLNDMGTGKALSENLSVNDSFNIQVKPALGSTLTIQRTLPAGFDSIMDLH